MLCCAVLCDISTSSDVSAILSVSLLASFRLDIALIYTLYVAIKSKKSRKGVKRWSLGVCASVYVINLYGMDMEANEGEAT